MTPEERRIVEMFTGKLEPLKHTYRIRVEGFQQVAKIFEIEATSEAEAQALFEQERAEFICDDWGDWEQSHDPDAIWIFPFQPAF